MADELKNAMDQLKTDVAAITGVQRAQLGQIPDALPDVTQAKAVCSVFWVEGGPSNDAYTSTSEQHRVDLRFYWLLTPVNVEVVEQNMATMWDRVMTKFYGDDADRNLTEKATIALIGGQAGDLRPTGGYELIGNKVHRVMNVPMEVVLDTHSV